MNIIIKDLEPNDIRTKRLTDHLDLLFFDWKEQSGLDDNYSLTTMLNSLPENRPLYKDSGLWQVRSENMEDVLFEQGVNESFFDFVKRVDDSGVQNSLKRHSMIWNTKKQNSTEERL